MKKETLKTVINLIVTVLTAIASAFCVQSCISSATVPNSLITKANLTTHH